ncbi:MFS transporter [Acidithiobacillus caldus]|uniref:MFS transporter n=1 Tax=Acidithiobacillus caldus TaxID=33059 RepID=UPI001D027BF6|nr:MFS transporter [Acidithiobacillus caldus]
MAESGGRVSRIDAGRRRIEAIAADLPPGRFLLLNLAIGLAHFLVLFNAGAYLAMIPEVAGALGVNANFAIWPQTDFFVGMALAAPLSLWLAARQGESRSFLLIFAGFGISALGCAETTEFWSFILARFAMGFFGGLSIPLSLAILRHRYRPGHERLIRSLWGVAALTPFTLAPAVGGWLCTHWGWRSLFYLDGPLALVLTGFVFLALRGLPSLPVRVRSMDWPGLMLLAAALATTQVTLDLGTYLDWWHSAHFWILTVIVAILWVTLWLWEWQHPQPLVAYRLFRHGNFFLGVVGVFAGTLLFQGMMALLVVQAQLVWGYTAFLAGVLVLPMAVTAKPASLISQWALRHWDAGLLAAVDLAGLALSCFLIATYDRDASYTALLWPQFVLGFFLGGLFLPLTRLALGALSESEAERGLGVFNLFRVAAQGYGIPILVGWLARVEQEVHHFLVEPGVASARPWQAATRALLARGLSPPAAKLQLARELSRHASFLAFNALFYACAWAFLALSALLLIFARPTTTAVTPSPAEWMREKMAEP